MQTNPTYRISLIMHSDTSSISSFSTISMNKGEFNRNLSLLNDAPFWVGHLGITSCISYSQSYYIWTLIIQLLFSKSIISLYGSLHQLFFLIIRFSCNHINIIILLHSSLTIITITQAYSNITFYIILFQKSDI